MKSKILAIVAVMLFWAGTALADPIDVSIDSGDGKSVVTMQNTTEEKLLATLTITNCNNLMGSSCGVILGRIPLNPGQTLTKIIIPSDAAKRFSFDAKASWLPVH